jgi:predicted transcriptional regulator
MAMTLRLSDDETDALRERAALEHRSMQEVAREAIAVYISDRSDRLRLAIRTVATEDAELLDRLSK